MSSRSQLAFRSPLTPVWLCGLVLFACMFLPFARGCDNEDIAPYQLYHLAEAKFEQQGVSAESVGMAVWVQWVNVPYVFGLIAAAATLVLAATHCRANAFRQLWWVYAVLTNLHVVALWWMIGYEARNADEFRLLQFVMHNPWISWPTLFSPMLFVVTRYNCRTWTAAALCVQCMLSTFCGAWFIHLMLGSLDTPSVPIGVKIALAASIALAVTSAIEWRCAHRVVQGVRSVPDAESLPPARAVAPHFSPTR